MTRSTRENVNPVRKKFDEDLKKLTKISNMKKVKKNGNFSKLPTLKLSTKCYQKKFLLGSPYV